MRGNSGDEVAGDLGVVLGAAVLDTIYAHAEAGHPDEVCGFVIGDGAGLVSEVGWEARRCTNRQNELHAEDPESFPRDAKTAYNLGPKDLLFLSRSLDGARPVRIIYHSHVEVGSYFSDEDVRAAAPEGELVYPVDYLVIDVKKEGDRATAKECRLFRFRPDHNGSGSFVEVGRHTR